MRREEATGAGALTRLASWSARSLAARETERSERSLARRKSMVIAVVASAAIAEPGRARSGVSRSPKNVLTGASQSDAHAMLCRVPCVVLCFSCPCRAASGGGTARSRTHVTP